MGDENDGETLDGVRIIPIEEDITIEDNDLNVSSKKPEWNKVISVLNKYYASQKKIIIQRDEESLKARRSDFGGTVLDLAVRYGEKKHLKFLFENDNFKSLVDTPNNNGRTPLHTAIIEKKDWAVKVLLKHYADPNARDELGKSPLHYLSSNSKWKRLIADNEEQQRKYKTFLDVDAFNKYEKTPRNQLELITGGQSSRAGRNTSNTSQTVKEESDTVPTPARPPNGLSTADRGPHANKIKQRANIYNLLMQRDYINLHRELQTPQDVDFYVDNKKLICHVLRSMESEEESVVTALRQIVEKLLEFGVSPLSSNNRRRESAVELALENKQRGLVEQMIAKLKNDEEKYADCKTDEMYDISFDLLRRAFTMTDKLNDYQEGERETMDWLQFLFKIDAIKNINQRNPRKGIRQTVLNIAANYNNERALVFLLKKGAALSEDNRIDVFKILTLESLTEVMSHAISFRKTKDELNVEVTSAAILNYRFLNPHQKKGERMDPYNGNTRGNIDESGGSNETDNVMSICQHYKDAISHPILWTFIMAKWSKLEKANTVYSVTKIVFSLALVIAFTALVWPISNHETDPTRSTNKRHVLKWTVFALCVISLVVEVSKIVLSLWPRSMWPHRSIKIFLSRACYDILITTLIITSCAGISSTNFVAWVVPGAWLNCAITMGEEITCLNTITTMLRKITLHIGKLCLFALFLVFGFSVSFSVLIGADQDSNHISTLADFSSPLLAFPRVVAMATGEFGYDELRDGLLVEERASASVSAVLLFLVFVFLVFLVIMNVMTGVAMVEAQEIKASAAENRLKRQLEVAYVYEQLSPMLPRYFKMLARAQLFKSKPELKVDMKAGEISFSLKVTDPPEPESDHLKSKIIPSKPEADFSESKDVLLKLETNTPEPEADHREQYEILHLDSETAKVLRQKLTRLYEETKKQNEKEDRHRKLEEIYRKVNSGPNHPVC